MAVASSGRPRGVTGALLRVACYALTTAWQQTPNLLSLGRLASIPFILLALDQGAHASAFYLFLAAAASDALDGFLAKRFTGVTAVGTILDPVADKLLVTGLLAGLATLGAVPSWLFLVALLRDVLIVGGVLVVRARTGPFRVAPHAMGKACTFLQVATVGTALLGLALVPAAAAWVPALSVVTGGVTVASGLVYLGQALRLAAAASAGRRAAG